MFDFIDSILENSTAREAPIMFGEPSPFKLKLWVCAGCLRVTPAIGLQAECPPTDWKRTTVDCSDMEEIAWRKTSHYLACPECKDKEDAH